MNPSLSRFPAGLRRSILWPGNAGNSLMIQGLNGLLEQQHTLEWEPLFDGVTVHWLYRQDDHGPGAGLIHFQPGARVPMHEHRGFEHIFVLRGSQRDENGHLETGGLMVHAPGTRHSIYSAEGCLVLAIYEKRARFLTAEETSPAPIKSL